MKKIGGYKTNAVFGIRAGSAEKRHCASKHWEHAAEGDVDKLFTQIKLKALTNMTQEFQ
jgi:hypothetical protein